METTLYKKVGRSYVKHNAYSDNLNGNYSTNELSIIVCKALSKIK